METAKAFKKHHHPRFRIIKGGKHHHYKNKNKKKKQFAPEPEYSKDFWAKACVRTLRLLQKVARLLNPAFFYERQIQHYRILESSIEMSEHAENYSLHILEKELILYKTFSRMNPRSVENYGRVLANAEEEFTAIIKEREETKTDHRTGLRHIAKHLILYVASGEEEIFIELHEDLLKYQDEHLLNAVYHITVHLNFLEGGEHE